MFLPTKTGLRSILPLLLLGNGTLATGDSPAWSQFLGPQRNGVVAATDLLSKWPAGGLEVAWRAEGGVGMSAVAVADGRAVTMWNSSQGQVLTALNAKDGSVLWTTPLAPSYKNAMGDGPRATPTIEGPHVFAYTGEGVLACLNVSTGEKIWTKSVVDEMSSRPAAYGMASSPLVVDDLVIVTVGGPQPEFPAPGRAVVALDRKNGDVRWSAVDGMPGYSSPALLDLDGVPHVVAFTGRGVTGIRPTDGKELWSYPFKTPYDCNTATPIAVDGKVFISAGENHGCVMLKVTKQGNRYSVDEVWASVDVKSVMRNEWQTSVLLDGYLYGFDNVGSAGPVTHLTCIDAATGEVAWRKTRFGKGNLVAADGILWITTMSGDLVMVQANPDAYSELGRQRIFGKTRQTASLTEGCAFIRDDSQVICIKIRSQ